MYYVVYKTTNIVNQKTYIGIHQTENLDDGYLGTGLAIKRAIKKYGKNNFKRKILEFCSSYGELIDREKIYVNEQWINEETNYNLKTGGQSAGLLSDESKKKISESLKKRYKTGEFKPPSRLGSITTEKQKKQISETLKEKYRNTTHHRVGCKPWNKGKKGSQKAWNKGIETGPMSEEKKKEISKTLTERYKTLPHPRKGGSSWNKGRNDLPPSWNKGLEMKKTQCPHCNIMIDIGNGKRWHFDNCKHK